MKSKLLSQKENGAEYKIETNPNYKVAFSGRAHQYNQSEIDVVIDAMTSANPLTQGKYLKLFENKMMQYLGNSHCFAVSTATAALEMSAQLCQFSDGDEVIVPAHTYTASAYPFFKKGAKIKWADIDIETRVITLDTIKACITERTKAIVVVHLYGYAVEMEPILNFAKDHNLYVIEDCAQAIGSDINGKKVGTFGDFGVFSFHSHKNISTLGEGGMLTTTRSEFAKIIPMLRHNGHCAFNFERDDYWRPCMGNVEMPYLNNKMLFPNNYCLGEVQCALGVKLLDRLDEINTEKRNRALNIIDSLNKIPQLKFHRVETSRHTYHLLVAECINCDRDDLIRTLANDYGIQTIVQYYPLNRYKIYKDMGYGGADCSNTDQFFDNMISFPFHHWLETEQLNYIVSSVKSYFS